VEHVKKVLAKLLEAKLWIKLTKCEFHRHSVRFLGFIISREGIQPDPDKVKSVEEWPTPKNVKEVQAFVGFANFYRRFVEGFSSIAAPLTALTKKGNHFKWGEEQEVAFQRIKEKLSSALILAIFNPEKEVFVEIDALDFAIGAYLTQKDA